jgi:hypothetical protein
MRKTEYTCDWCQTTMPPEHANQFSVQPVFLFARETAPHKLPDSAMDKVKSLANRNAQAMEADICDSCFARLRAWIETEATRSPRK